MAAVSNGFGRYTIYIPRSGLAILCNLLFVNFLISLRFYLLGTGVCITRLYYMVVFDFSPDGFYLMVDRFIWSRAEESLMVIAACAPLMKSPFERLLKRLGLA